MNGGDRRLEDCYYYLYSSCRRGHDCTFRHSPDARASTKICPEWEKTRRCTVDCPLRHNTHQVQRRKADEYCYFEDKEPGCTKPFCEFKHKNPEKDAWKLSGPQNGLNTSALLVQEENVSHGWMHDSRFLDGNLSGVQDHRYDSTQQNETTSKQLEESAVCQEYDLVDDGLVPNNSSTPILANEIDSREDPDSASGYWTRRGSTALGTHHAANEGLSEYSSSDMTTRSKSFRDKPLCNARNNPNTNPSIILRSDELRSDEKNHSRLGGNDDFKKPKPNAFDGEDKRRKDGRWREQYVSRGNEQRSIGDEKANRDGTELHIFDKGYFKKIRMENKILVNEIEDVEREIDEIERRISQESSSV